MIKNLIFKTYKVLWKWFGWRGTVISQLINKNKYKSFVEVGVREGETTGYVVKKCKGLKKIVGIDPFLDIPQLFKYVVKKFKKYPNVKILKDYSVSAAKKFKDNSIDIVFIDALHSYKAVKEDIETWYPKVRKGGIICGHDYTISYFGVVMAVNEFFGVDNVTIYSDSVWVVPKGKSNLKLDVSKSPRRKKFSNSDKGGNNG